jgi:hypothetical protein
MPAPKMDMSARFAFRPNYYRHLSKGHSASLAAFNFDDSD